MTNSIYFLLFMFFLSSCSIEDEKATYWGKTDYYNDFLFYDYEPNVMTRSLVLNFNEDAKEISNIRFGVFEKDFDNGRTNIIPSDIRLYKNGVLCRDNTFFVSGKESKVDIGIEFLGEADEGMHKWYLVLLDSKDLNRVNDLEIELSNNYPVVLEWIAKKNDHWNPLALSLFIILLLLLALLVIWLLVIKKIIYPTFKVGAISVLEPIFDVSKLRGYRKVVFSNKRRTQSIINKFFTGRILYRVNPIWIDEWELLPRDKNSVRIDSGGNYIIDPFSTLLSKGIEYDLKNNKINERIKIMIN